MGAFRNNAKERTINTIKPQNLKSTVNHGRSVLHCCERQDTT